MIKTLLVTIFVAAIAEQADLVFRDGGNSCTIFKTEGTRTVHSQCDFHSPNVDAEVQDLKERMTRVEARLPTTPAPTENPTKNPTKTPSGFTKTGDGSCRTSGQAFIRSFRSSLKDTPIVKDGSNAEKTDYCNAQCAKTVVCIGTSISTYKGDVHGCSQHVSSRAAWVALPSSQSGLACETHWTPSCLTYFTENANNGDCSEGCAISDSPDDVEVHGSADYTGECYKKDVPPTQAPTDTPTVPGHQFADHAALTSAVYLWRHNRVSALAAYGDISTWDTSKVESFSSLFKGDSGFNDPIGNWDTSSATTLYGMFRGATSFNQPIGAWDTSKVTFMHYMFREAKAFNQPIGHWDTSKVTTLASIFAVASAFNQPIGDWDTSKVTDMRWLLRDVTAFNQPISAWDTSKVTKLPTCANGLNKLRPSECP